MKINPILNKEMKIGARSIKMPLIVMLLNSILAFIVILFFYAYVGNLSYADALYRYNIFKSHIDSALQAIIYGDRMLLSKYPELLNTPIYIKFDSSIPVFNNYEFYGFVRDYII